MKLTFFSLLSNCLFRHDRKSKRSFERVQKTILLKKIFPEKPAEKNLDKRGSFMVKSKIADK